MMCDAPFCRKMVLYFGKSEKGQRNFGMVEDFGFRLREERQRINPKQADFASFLGVRQSQLSEWEKGSSGLKANHLAMLASAGIDIMYVLTGQRSGKLLPIPESQLLDSFRAIDPIGQEALISIAQRMANRAPIKTPASIHDRKSDYRGE